jgi:hypothetical protein
VAVRRRPSYGFDIAGSSLGLRPEAGVSRSTLAQLFPEIDLGAPAGASTTMEEVEKPEEATTTTTPAGTGVTALAEDDTIPGSELEKYKISGSLSYAAPFNLQVGPSGPQGRGSRLGYSGATGASTPTASQPTTTPVSQSASSFAMPELPQFDYSPFESLLAQGQSIMDQIQSASQTMGAPQQQQPEPTTEPKPTTEPEPDELIKRHLPPRRLRFRFDCKLKRLQALQVSPLRWVKLVLKVLFRRERTSASSKSRHVLLVYS